MDINEFPIALAILYLFIEGLKVYLPHRRSKDKIEEHTRDEVTDAVFEMYSLSKKDIEADKKEIRELNKSLKRANLEVILLERKLAALMRAFDSILGDNPRAHAKYVEAISKYKIEMDGITATMESEI